MLALIPSLKSFKLLVLKLYQKIESLWRISLWTNPRYPKSQCSITHTIAIKKIGANAYCIYYCEHTVPKGTNVTKHFPEFFKTVGLYVFLFASQVISDLNVIHQSIKLPNTKILINSQNVAFGDYARPAGGPTHAARSARNQPPYSSLRSPPPPTPHSSLHSPTNAPTQIALPEAA